MNSEIAIQCIDLTKTYKPAFFSKPVVALNRLNLTVYRGEIFGFLGPNGAGKTTTIRLMLDLIRPTDGICQIFGINSAVHAVVIKQQVGSLPAELRLWEHMTGEEVIRYMANLRPGSDLGYAWQLAEQLQLNLALRVRQYSTGNKRKVGIVQALMHRPSLVIMDEPTMGLDPLMRQLFAEALLKLRQQGSTVFLSSHVLSEVQAVCDRVGILRRGQLQAVIDLNAMVQRRWMLITTQDVIDTDVLGLVSGVDKVEETDTGYRLRISGSTDALLKILAHYQIEDLRSGASSLEEQFMDVYRESN